jgi:hypothetical protein
MTAVRRLADVGRSLLEAWFLTAVTYQGGPER